MTIELLAESFREAKAKVGHPARIKYPKKLKDAAIEYFKANPSLTPRGRVFGQLAGADRNQSNAETRSRGRR